MSRSPSPRTKVIQIKAGSTLDPLKESGIFNGTTKEKLNNSPFSEKQRAKSMIGGLKKGKNSVTKTREEYIKETVKAYFD